MHQLVCIPWQEMQCAAITVDFCMVFILVLCVAWMTWILHLCGIANLDEHSVQHTC